MSRLPQPLKTTKLIIGRFNSVFIWSFAYLPVEKILSAGVHLIGDNLALSEGFALKAVDMIMTAAAVSVAVVVHAGIDGLKAALVHKPRVVQDDLRIAVGEYSAFF